MNKTRIPTVIHLNMWQENIHGIYYLYGNRKLKLVDPDDGRPCCSVALELGTNKVLADVYSPWLHELLRTVQPQDAYEMVFAIKRLLNLLMAARLEVPMDSRLGPQIDEVITAVYGDPALHKTWDDMEHYRNQSLNIKDYKIKASQ